MTAPLLHKSNPPHRLRPCRCGAPHTCTSQFGKSCQPIFQWSAFGGDAHQMMVGRWAWINRADDAAEHASLHGRLRGREVTSLRRLIRDEGRPRLGEASPRRGCTPPRCPCFLSSATIASIRDTLAGKILTVPYRLAGGESDRCRANNSPSGTLPLAVSMHRLHVRIIKTFRRLSWQLGEMSSLRATHRFDGEASNRLHIRTASRSTRSCSARTWQCRPPDSTSLSLQSSSHQLQSSGGQRPVTSMRRG